MTSETDNPTAGAVTPFEFEGHDVRVIDRDGEPWVVLADVCRVLEIANPRDAASRLDDDEKATVNTVGFSDGIPRGRGNPNVTIVNESGLYTVILRCQGATTPGTLPHRFRRWVTGEVLPSIRKTGRYDATAAPPADEPDDVLMARALLAADKRMKELTATVQAQREEIQELAPKASAYDHLTVREGCHSLTEAAKVLGLRRNAFIRWLHANGWIYRRGGPWLAYSEREKAGHLTHRYHEYIREDGSQGTSAQVLVTPRGMAILAQRLGRSELPLNTPDSRRDGAPSDVPDA